MTLAIAITQPVYAKQKNYDGVLKGSRDMWSSAISKFSLCFIIMMSERERERRSPKYPYFGLLAYIHKMVTMLS